MASLGADRIASLHPARGCVAWAPSTWKKPMVDSSESDWLESSSAVAAISSDAEAFLLDHLIELLIALLTCVAPVFCSALAAAISRTSSAVLWISGTSLANSSPAPSAV